MARSVYNDPAFMRELAVIRDFDEDKYSDIPGFEGEYLASTPDAVLLIVQTRGERRREVWFPFSQLRRAEDGLSLYASNWILDRKL